MKYERSRSGVLLRDVPSLVREVHAFHRDHRAGLDLVRAAGREAQAQVRSVTVKRNIGRRISKAGLAVILLPDPFSDVIGLPMVMLGELINRAYSSLTLTDVMKEVRSTMEALSEAQWISRLK